MKKLYMMLFFLIANVANLQASSSPKSPKTVRFSPEIITEIIEIEANELSRKQRQKITDERKKSESCNADDYLIELKELGDERITQRRSPKRIAEKKAILKAANKDLERQCTPLSMLLGVFMISMTSYSVFDACSKYLS